MNILLKSFRYDILTQTHCTESSFLLKCNIPCVRIVSSRFLANILFNHLSRKYFTNIGRHIFTTIYGGSSLREAFENIQECTVLPNITIFSTGIQIDATNRMIALPSVKMPHNVYLKNEFPEEITTTAILCFAQSLASGNLQLYKCRLHIFERDHLLPTIMALYAHRLKLNIRNSKELCCAVVYLHIEVCSSNGTLPYQLYRLQVSLLNTIAQSITTQEIEPTPEIEEHRNEPSTSHEEPTLPLHSPPPETNTVMLLTEDDEETDSDDDYVIPSRNLTDYQFVTHNVYNLRST